MAEKKTNGKGTKTLTKTKKKTATVAPAGNDASAPRKSRVSKVSAARKSTKVRADPAASPANMRDLSRRRIANVCDNVAVTGKFATTARCAVPAPDGTCWTGESDGTIVIRLVPSGAEVGQVAAFGRATVQVMLKVAGRIWAGYSDGAIRIFDPYTQMLVHESTKHTAAVYAMAAADGYVYTGGADWKIYMWEADDMHFCRMFYGHGNTVRTLATYTSQETGGRFLVSGADDGLVKLWEAKVSSMSAAKVPGANEKDTACVATLECQGKSVLCATVTPDTEELWVGCEDSAVRVWDLCSMTITAVVTAHRTPVVSMHQVEDTIWTASKDGTIIITNRFSKDVVHEAAQAPTTTASSGVARLPVSIQPVHRTVVHNVWASAADGNWQCWSFTAPDATLASLEEQEAQEVARQQLRAKGLPPSTYVSMRRSESGRQLGSVSRPRARDPNFAALDPAKDEEMRASVARTRSNVNTMLAEDATVRVETPAATAAYEDDDDAIPIEAVEQSIRRDHEEETEKEERLAASTGAENEL